MNFPIDELNLEEIGIGPQRYPPVYRLFAKIDHIGSNESGHYVAHAKNCENQNWFVFDDEIVKPSKDSEVVNSNAYVLFYHNDSTNQYPTQSVYYPQFWPHCLRNESKKNSDIDFNFQALDSTGMSCN